MKRIIKQWSLGIIFFIALSASCPASALLLKPEIIQLPLLLEVDLGIVSLNLDLDLVVTGTPVPDLTVSPRTPAATTGITMTATNLTVLNATNLGAKIHVAGKPLTSGTFYFDVTATNVWGSDTETVCVTIKAPPVVPVASIALSASTLDLDPGNTYLLNCTISPAGATNKVVTWTSSNPAIAAVDANGLVTAKSTGSAVITATAQGGTGITATCTVTVGSGSTSVSVTGVAISENTATLTVGETKLLTASVQPANASIQGVTWTTSSPAVASVSAGGLVTALSPGNVTITATTADGNFQAICTVTVNAATIAVGGIAVSPMSLEIPRGGTASLSYTISPANATDKTVIWTSSNPAVAAVDADGLVTAGGLGSAVITATTQDGGKTATCQITVTNGTGASVSGISLNVSNLTLNVGDTRTLTFTIAPADATDQSVTWTTNNAAVAAISAGGVITGIGAGSTTVRVTTNDGNFFAVCTVTVNPTTVPVTGIAVSPASLSIPVGGSASLTYTVSPDGATNKIAAWSTADAAVATVDSSGTVEGVAVGGPVAITATSQSDPGQSGSSQVTVVASGGGPVTDIALSPDSLDLAVGDSRTLTFAITPNDADNQVVAWSTGNPAVASVSANGLVSALSPGTTTITVTAQDGSNASAVCTVTVSSSSIPVNGVALSGPGGPLDVGDTRTLTVTFDPSNASNQGIYWSSSNPDVATAADGVVTGIGPGTATITVTTQDGAKQATYVVTVQAVGGVTPLSRIDVYPTYWEMDIGATKLLGYTATPSTATNKAVTWGSSDGAVASVSANGLVTAAAQSTAVITATAQDGSGKTSSCTVVVSNNPAAPVTATSVTVSPSVLSLNVGSTRLLGVSILPDNATNQSVSWASGSPSVATVGANGLVAAVAAGTATIVATVDGKTGNCVVTVAGSGTPGGTDPNDGGTDPGSNPGTKIRVSGVMVFPTAASLDLGQVLQIQYTVIPENAADKQVDWSSSNPAVVAVGADGKLTALSAGTAVVTLTTRDGGKKAMCVVSVLPTAGEEAIGIDLSRLGLVNGILELKAGQEVDLTLAGTPAGIRFGATGLPGNLVLTSAGRLYGRAEQVGTFAVTLTVTAPDGTEETQDFIVKITSGDAIATTGRRHSTNGCNAAGLGLLALAALLPKRGRRTDGALKNRQ